MNLFSLLIFFRFSPFFQNNLSKFSFFKIYFSHIASRTLQFVCYNQFRNDFFDTFHHFPDFVSGNPFFGTEGEKGG